MNELQHSIVGYGLDFDQHYGGIQNSLDIHMKSQVKYKWKIQSLWEIHVPQLLVSLCCACPCLQSYYPLVHFLVEEDTILQGLQAYRVHGPGFSHSMPQLTATLRPHVCVTVYSMCFIRSPQLLVTDKGSVTCYKSGVFAFFSPFFQIVFKGGRWHCGIAFVFPTKWIQKL